MNHDRLFAAVLLLALTVTPLAPLAWLEGGTWVSQLQSPDGRPLRVECRFTRGAHGRTLRYTIDFKTGDATTPQYEGVYYWHPGKKQIHMIQVDRAGNLTESVATVDGDTMRQENIATHADGTSSPQRVSVTRKGDDAFEFKAMVQRDGQWVDAVGFTYRRERDAAEAPRP